MQTGYRCTITGTDVPGYTFDTAAHTSIIFAPNQVGFKRIISLPAFSSSNIGFDLKRSAPFLPNVTRKSFLPILIDHDKLVFAKFKSSLLSDKRIAGYICRWNRYRLFLPRYSPNNLTLYIYIDDNNWIMEPLFMRRLRVYDKHIVPFLEVPKQPSNGRMNTCDSHWAPGNDAKVFCETRHVNGGKYGVNEKQRNKNIVKNHETLLHWECNYIQRSGSQSLWLQRQSDPRPAHVIVTLSQQIHKLE